MTLPDLIFTTPGWLWLLPLPGAIALWRRLLLRGEPLPPPPPLAALFHPGMPEEEGTSPRHPFRRLRPLAWWSALTLLPVALAGPALPAGPATTRSSPAPELLFLVDTSVAMALRDYRIGERAVSRMEVLKERLHRFVEGSGEGRLGLVVFGSEAHTLLPPTRDRALLHHLIRRIPTTLAGRESALGEAVLLGVRLASGRQPPPALVLFSAAPPPPGGTPPMAAAEVARRLGVPLHTVALGDSEAGEAEVPAGLVHQPPDTRLLEAMARLGGGGYWRVGDGSALAEALAAIARRDASRRPADDPSSPPTPLYPWPLALALLLLALAEALPRLPRRGTDGR